MATKLEGGGGEALGPGHYFLFFFCGYPKFHDGQFLFVLRSWLTLNTLLAFLISTFTKGSRKKI